MSKHKPGFPRVGKKGKETRFSSRIAGCRCDCDPAWSIEPPVALRAGCWVHTGPAACDPVLSQGKRKVPGLSSTRVMEIWLPWAFLLPWTGSSAHPQAIASVHFTVHHTSLVLRAMTSAGLQQAQGWRVLVCAKSLALQKNQGFLPLGMHQCLVEVFQVESPSCTKHTSVTPAIPESTFK